MIEGIKKIQKHFESAYPWLQFYDLGRSFHTKWLKRLLPLFILSLIITLTSFTLIKKESFSLESVYLYFYSSIIQGYLTLVALLGTTVIYKLQQLENSADNLAQKIKDILVPLDSQGEIVSSTWASLVEKIDGNSEYFLKLKPQFEGKLSSSEKIFSVTGTCSANTEGIREV